MKAKVTAHKAQLRVLRKEPGKRWHWIVVDNTLEALQAEVGGYIEACRIASDCVILCNEEGKLLGLPDNGFMGFNGTILALGEKGDEFDDLPFASARLLMERGNGVLRG